jgi:leucine dehydrogenase
MSFGAEGFLDLIRDWEGRCVVTRYDAPTGAWMLVAVHDDTLGPAVGGCRMKVYPSPEEGLRDALRLSEGMTLKWAAAGLPFGGGKAVLALRGPLDAAARTGLLYRFGGLLNTLRGAYATGPDMGTTPDDMREIATVSDHVSGLAREADWPSDPGPFTALGVLAGIKAALRHRRGSDSLDGVRVLVQGVGGVGEPLARALAAEGATVLLSDLDENKAFSLAVELGGSGVNPEIVYDAACDVYAPCAVGATLNADTIARLECEIVAGSANNQLETDDDAHRLAARGILYAPDFVINAGGAMAFGLLHRRLAAPDELGERVSGIGKTLSGIFMEAEELGGGPLAAARRLAERALGR